MEMEKSAVVYSKSFLSFYDLYVLRFSNTFVWNCPSKILLDFYNFYISSTHLDVGVGTGYFLDTCKFPSPQPDIHLLDLNPNTLEKTAQRIERYKPKIHQANIMQPLDISLPTFDSIGVNYLLHCLPGNFFDKEIVFRNLKPLLNKDGILFGSTIVSDKAKPNFLARKLLNIYNAKGIFGNTNDTLDDLEKILMKNFTVYTLQIQGCVVMFTAKV